MFGNLVGQDLGLGCSVLQPFASSSPLQQDGLSSLQSTPSGHQLMAFSGPGSSGEPCASSLLPPSFGSAGSGRSPDGTAAAGGRMVVKRDSSSSLSSATAAVLTREVLMELLPTRKKGKGGRQPAQDPRLDPSIDPKRAKRILANRQSAARSKLKQKMLMDGLRTRRSVLGVQRDAAAQELCQLSTQCQQLERDNQLMRCRLQALADQYRLKSALTTKLTNERDKLARRAAPAAALQPAAAPQLAAAAWAQSDAAAAAGLLAAGRQEAAIATRPQHTHCHLLPMAASQQLVLQCP